MDLTQYRKFWVALAGAAVTALGVVADQADSLPLPASWRPWAAVLVALATALGVHQVPNAPASTAAATQPYDPPRPWRDTGSVMVAGALVILAGASLAAGAIGLAGHRRPTPLDWVGITCAAIASDGSIDVTFDQQRPAGRAWTALQDDGDEVVQLHEVGARYGTAGEWVTVGTAHGEAHWHIPALGPVEADQVRVVRTATGITSAAYPIGGCAA